MVDKGISLLINTSIASSSNSLLPLADTITGYSTTIFFALYSFSFSAIVSIRFLLRYHSNLNGIGIYVLKNAVQLFLPKIQE